MWNKKVPVVSQHKVRLYFLFFWPYLHPLWALWRHYQPSSGAGHYLGGFYFSPLLNWPLQIWRTTNHNIYRCCFLELQSSDLIHKKLTVKCQTCFNVRISVLEISKHTSKIQIWRKIFILTSISTIVGWLLRWSIMSCLTSPWRAWGFLYVPLPSFGAVFPHFKWVCTVCNVCDLHQILLQIGIPSIL